MKHIQQWCFMEGLKTVGNPITCQKNRFIKSIFCLAAFLFTFFIFITPAMANPEGGTVTGGSATISSPNSTTVQVNQNSQNAVIDWRSYNIAANEQTIYQQPNASAIALNRIDPSQGASQILGRLSANGQVWLMNPAGILFGSSAVVDAAGVLATTASITNADFMSGNFHFVQDPNWNGAVINQGSITVADKGLVMLVAPGVENSGMIQANLGVVTLASTNEYTVDFYGDQLINFGMNSKVERAAQDKDGNELKDAVRNSGNIIANGGKVILTAQAAGKVLDHAVNMNGYIEAQSATAQNGVVVLQGGDEGIVQVSGRIDASGKKTAQKGGKVIVRGEKTAIAKNASIDVSGDAGGGEILIGGDYQGSSIDGLSNSQRTYVGTGSILNASALTEGDGGKVIVWADNDTVYFGNILARGGDLGGKGGFVEVSGKEALGFYGAVDTSAPFGSVGTLLLDPRTITVASSGSATLADVDQFSETPSTDLTIAASTIEAATTNVILQANRDITFSAAVNLGSGYSLTAQAARDINVNAAVSTNGGGDITFVANDSSSGASNSNRTTQTGDLTIGASGSLTANDGGDISLTIDPTTTNPFQPGTMSLRALTANNITISNTANAVTFNGDVTATGSVTVTAGNTLSQASGTTLSGDVLTAKTLKNTGADISLAESGNDFNSIDLRTRNTADTSDANGAISYRDVDEVAIAAANTGSTVSVTSGGNMTQTGSMTGTTLTALTLNDVGADMALNASNEFATVNLKARNAANSTDAAGTIEYVDATGFAISGVATTDSATLIGTGNITQSSALTMTSGSLFVGAGSANDITLSNTSNNFNIVGIVSGNVVSLRDSGAMTLGTSNVNGDLTIRVAGLLDQNGAATVGGTTTLIAGANNIDLSNSSNDFGTVTVTSGNNVMLQDQNALELGASTISGTFDVTTGGALTDSGKISVTGETTLTSGSNDITLDTATNDFSTLKITSAHDVTIVDANALIMDTSALTGNLFLTLTGATGGALSQVGAMSGDVLTVLVKNNTASRTNIDLSNVGNSFSSIDLQTLNNAGTSSVAGTITYTDANAIQIDRLTSSGTVSLTSSGEMTQGATYSITATGSVTLSAGVSNDITLDGSNDFGSVGILMGQDVTLNDINALALNDSTINGTLDVTTSGAITDNGALIVGGATTLAAGILNDITLDAANNFSSVGITTGQNVTLNDINALALNDSTINGTLDVTTSGAITDNGALIVDGVTTLAAGILNDITLDAANNFSSVGITTGQNVTLNDINALALNDSTINGTLDVTTSGAITDNGALIVIGATTLAAGVLNDITLDAANNFSSIGITTGQNVTLNDINALALNDSTMSGTLDVTTSGAITDNGALIVGGATTLVAGVLNDITLDASNNFSSIGITTGQNVTLNDINALALNDSTISNDLTVTTNGAITQNGALTVTGNTALNSSTGSIVLTAANDFIGSVNVSTSGATTLVDQNALTLGASTVGGTLSATAGTDLTVADDITSTGEATLVATGGSFAIANGAQFSTTNDAINIIANDLNLNVSGALNAGSGTITITHNVANGIIGLGNITGSADMSISSSELQRISSGALNITAANNGRIDVYSITNSDLADISGMITLTATEGASGRINFFGGSSVFHALTAEADDSITLYGNLSSEGSISLSANNGIMLTTPVTLTALGGLTLGALNGSYNLTLDAGSSGNITLNGNLGSNTARLGVLSIINSNNITNQGTIYAASYNQSAGSGTVNFGTGGLDVAGDASIVAHTVNGFMTVRGLNLYLDSSFANITGSVAGLSNIYALVNHKIVVLNTISPGTHFFNGIDMKIPTPSDTAQVIFPDFPTLSQSTLIPSILESIPDMTPDNLEGISNDSCVQVGTLLKVCM